jgi:hypothetical protein
MAKNQEGEQPLEVTVGTTHISIAAIASAWLRRKVLQLWDGGLRPRTMYFDTVDWATLKPRHQQLAVDPRRTPQRVTLAYPPDQITQASVDRRPPCPPA